VTMIHLVKTCRLSSLIPSRGPLTFSRTPIACVPPQARDSELEPLGSIPAALACCAGQSRYPVSAAVTY
jgi:hypothetical protein